MTVNTGIESSRATTPPGTPPSRRSVVRRHPLLSFVVVNIALTWSVQLAFLALGWPLFPVALVIELALLFGTAVAITRLTEGREGVRRLMAGALRWRIGTGWTVAVLVLLPVATLVVGAVAGTLQPPADGYTAEVLLYLFMTLVFGALLGNLWEELAWTGFLQSRLAERYGTLKGALLTAVPFGLIHLPLALEADGLTGTRVGDLTLAWGLLLLVAPFFRYLVGMTYASTGGSVLAVAVLHGSFNAGASASVVTGGWEYIAGVVVVTPLVALALAWWRRRTAAGRRLV
jgi:membrane protease YdiL (CAAX protease family)